MEICKRRHTLRTNGYIYPDNELYDYVITEFNSKGVTKEKIGEIVFDLEHDFLPDLTLEDYTKEVSNVLHKREVLNNIATGLYLDKMANKGKLDKPLQSIIENDAGVYGVDEVLATAVANIYGSIGVTNYGFEDKTKSGIIGSLDNKHGVVNTFIDDAVGAIAAAVAGKLAHATVKSDMDNLEVTID